MPPARIIPAFDEPKDRDLGFAAVLKAMFDEQFALERRVETLAHGKVVAVSDGSHRRPDAGIFAGFAEGN